MLKKDIKIIPQVLLNQLVGTKENLINKNYEGIDNIL